MKYNYVKDYKSNDYMRNLFNELTEKTFGFNFEKWYSNGFWEDKYIPHSLVDGDKMVANVSVNLMDFLMDGIKKQYIQIGTVMTDENYRHQGLSRFLMNKVINEYQDKVDGIYLFGNDQVIHFYPKFGFKKGKEYQYYKSIESNNHEKQVESIDMSNKENRNLFINAINNSISNDRFSMDNIGLISFWTMGSNIVYYLRKEDAFILAQVNGEHLMLHQIIANHKVDLESVIHAFGKDIKQVKLGFTPLEKNGFTIEELNIEDCTLFILGNDLRLIENKKLMFPTLSHA